MKKIILIGIFLATVLNVQAQVNPHALGLRLGGNGTYSRAEISYQHGMSDVNRLEFDLGFSGNKDYKAMFLTGTYQWVWNIQGGLNWYAGPGAALGFANSDDNSSFNLGVGGQIGIEYDLNTIKAPLLLSLDFRPMWSFIGDSGFGWGFALGVRYTW